MPVELTWINHASFRIQGQDAVLYIDPWKLPHSPHDADIVFISHSHFDHLSLPDIAAVTKPDTVVVAPESVIESLHARNSITPGEQVTIKDVTIEAVAMYNIGKTFHPKGNNWCGAVFTIDGQRVYYAGDTDLIPEMTDLKDVDLALLPVGGTYTLTAAEAARACEAIRPRAAIPYHYGDIVGEPSDGETFRKLAACPVHLLRPGQTLVLEAVVGGR